MIFYKGWRISYVSGEGTATTPYWVLRKGFFQVIWLDGRKSIEDVKRFIDEMCKEVNEKMIDKIAEILKSEGIKYHRYGNKNIRRVTFQVKKIILRSGFIRTEFLCMGNVAIEHRMKVYQSDAQEIRINALGMVISVLTKGGIKVRYDGDITISTGDTVIYFELGGE